MEIRQRSGRKERIEREQERRSGDREGREVNVYTSSNRKNDGKKKQTPPYYISVILINYRTTNYCGYQTEEEEEKTSNLPHAE